jgi:dsRNA-specific ribonuclease
MRLFTTLWGDASFGVGNSAVPAKSRLQQLVQEVTKTEWKEVVRFEYEELHGKNEAHKAEFLVRVFIRDVQVGEARGRSKRSAAESACEAALGRAGLVELIAGEQSAGNIPGQTGN